MIFCRTEENGAAVHNPNGSKSPGSLTRNDRLTEQFDQMMFADVAEDRIDDEVGQGDAILDDEVVAVEIEEIVGGGEGGALVPLEERVIAGDPEQ